MQSRFTLTLSLAAAAMLATGCGSAPKLPQANGAFKPANDSDYIEALKLRADMENARRELELARRSSEARNMLLQPMAMPMGMKTGAAGRTGGPIPVFDMRSAGGGANMVYTIRFALGATRPALGQGNLKSLVDAAKAAPIVSVRGRTDAAAFTAGNDRVARLRAQETVAMLVRAGVDSRRIRATWQAAGDTVASNETVEGRALNRRVEIEVYAAQPEAAVLDQPSPAAVASN